MADIEVSALTDDQLAEALGVASRRSQVALIGSAVFVAAWRVAFALLIDRFSEVPAFMPIMVAILMTGAAVVWTVFRSRGRQAGAVRAELKRRGRDDLLPAQPRRVSGPRSR